MARVLITGAARGIGLALAKQYLAAGDEVIACVRNTDAEALVALAGTGPLTIEHMDMSDFDSIAPLLVARAFKANLAASGNGKLMNVTSQLGASTWPMGGMLVYATTKAALNKIGQILALDWGRAHQRRARASRLGQDRHGRPARTADPGRQRQRDPRADRRYDQGRLGPVLQVERRDPSLVGGSHG
jgi:NAD(P)-dependent dehydrogenase (short-subunit alcohol dehydrogenase family)